MFVEIATFIGVATASGCAPLGRTSGRVRRLTTVGVVRGSPGPARHEVSSRIPAPNTDRSANRPARFAVPTRQSPNVQRRNRPVHRNGERRDRHRHPSPDPSSTAGEASGGASVTCSGNPSGALGDRRSCCRLMTPERPARRPAARRREYCPCLFLQLERDGLARSSTVEPNAPLSARCQPGIWRFRQYYQPLAGCANERHFWPTEP